MTSGWLILIELDITVDSTINDILSVSELCSYQKWNQQ